MSNHETVNQAAITKKGMGWLPDYPDIRDYTPTHAKIQPLLAKANVASVKATLPAAIDLRLFFPPIEDQGSIGSCTANAGVGLVEYFQRRAYGKHVDASKLFLYKTTRNLLQWTGDTGAFLRTTMGALALFGVPPEKYWPYQIADYDKEPPAFCYAFAQNYQAISYYRLDPPGTPAATLLERIKTNIAGGLPSMFGFTVYDSLYTDTGRRGKIPYPGAGEKIAGGHAVVAIGYDDNVRIKNPTSGQETVGAIIIRNSWGTSWGESGYGYLPYAYVLNGLAVDWWSLIKNEWLETGNFGL